MGRVKACAVRGCAPANNNKLRHYTFPTNKILARKWVEKCSRGNNINVKYAAICQNHFSSAQIRRNVKYELLNLPVPSNWRNLKVDAIPDLNLPSHGHQQDGIGPTPAFRGAPAASHDRNNPDWAPTLNLGHEKFVPSESLVMKSKERYEQLLTRTKRAKASDAAQGLLQLHKQAAYHKVLPAAAQPGPEMLPAAAQPGPEVLPVAAQPGPEMMPAAAQLGPKVLIAAAQTGPKVLPTAAQPGPEVLPTAAQPGPEVMPAVAQLSPKVLIAAAHLSPKVLPAASQPDPEVLPAAAQPGPEVLPAAAQLSPKVLTAAAHLSPKVVTAAAQLSPKSGLVQKIGSGKVAAAVDKVESKMEEENFATTERNLFSSPDPLALLLRLNREERLPPCMNEHLFSSYVKTLSLEQRCHYLSKLRLTNPRVCLPDPYKIEEWVKKIKKWPDLNSSHLHQYLLSRDTPQAGGEDTACASLMGYNAFKLGNVLEVKYTSINVTLVSTVCFLKALVISPYQGGLESHMAWVCLDERDGTISASHCTCLKRFEEVCSHIAGLLFKVEAATSLGMNKRDAKRSSISNSTSKVTMTNKCNRSRLCVARVKDTYFTHQNSNKGLRQPLKDLKLKPPSKSEQNRAMKKLRKIIPNSLIFLKEDSETDTASEAEEDRKKLSHSGCHPHTSNQGFESERHIKNPASEGEEEHRLSSPLHHNAFSSSDDDTSSVVSAFDFEGFASDDEVSGLGATT